MAALRLFRVPSRVGDHRPVTPEVAGSSPVAPAFEPPGDRRFSVSERRHRLAEHGVWQVNWQVAGVRASAVRPDEHDPFVPQWAITLLAVLAGGAVTYIGQLLIEARRERSAHEAEKRAASAELRTAIRLTMDELETVHLHQQLILDEGRYPSNRDVIDRLMPTADWETHRGTLARELPDDQWESLARTMTSVASQRAIIKAGLEGEQIPEAVLIGARNGAALTADIYARIVGKAPLAV